MQPGLQRRMTPWGHRPPRWAPWPPEHRIGPWRAEERGGIIWKSTLHQILGRTAETSPLFGRSCQIDMHVFFAFSKCLAIAMLSLTKPETPANLLMPFKCSPRAPSSYPHTLAAPSFWPLTLQALSQVPCEHWVGCGGAPPGSMEWWKLPEQQPTPGYPYSYSIRGFSSAKSLIPCEANPNFGTGRKTSFNKLVDALETTAGVKKSESCGPSLVQALKRKAPPVNLKTAI